MKVSQTLHQSTKTWNLYSSDYLFAIPKDDADD